MQNLWVKSRRSSAQESIQCLLKTDSITLERIVSIGHKTPAGRWYDQKKTEWVVLLRGGAKLRFEHEKKLRILKPGDWLIIPAGQRHRVEWTRPKSKTIWLALHYDA